MSMIEQVKEFSTKQANEKSEKISVLSAEIVVHGSIEKPYYEIEYYDLSDRKYHTGYSSYDLNNVLRWREECFEILKENECGTFFSKQVADLRSYSNVSLYARENEVKELLWQASDTIEFLSSKLKVANMDESVECDGWIPCSSGKMPDASSTVFIQLKYSEDGISGDDEMTYDISFSRTDKNEWVSSCGTYTSEDVIAWREIKPYYET